MTSIPIAKHKPTASDLIIRRATAADAPGAADLYIDTFKATYPFPLGHEEADVRRWMRQALIPHYEVWLAIDASDQIVGLMALDEMALEQLYITPDWQRRGLGSRFVTMAKERRPRGLVLHTFQVNAQARAFYERHGFKLYELTDGSENDERQPDVCYTWVP